MPETTDGPALASFLRTARPGCPRCRGHGILYDVPGSRVRVSAPCPECKRVTKLLATACLRVHADFLRRVNRLKAALEDQDD